MATSASSPAGTTSTPTCTWAQSAGAGAARSATGPPGASLARTTRAPSRPRALGRCTWAAGRRPTVRGERTLRTCDAQEELLEVLAEAIDGEALLVASPGSTSHVACQRWRAQQRLQAGGERGDVACLDEIAGGAVVDQRGNAAPARADDGEAVRHGLEDREGHALGLIERGETEHVSLVQ